MNKKHDIRYVVSFHEIDKESLPEVGGKGANLGEMSRAGFPVPPGFCVTTEAFREFLDGSQEMEGLFQELERLDVENLDAVRIVGERVRRHLLTLPMPEAVEQPILYAWREIGTGNTYAVRSSATAEDLPTASFAGQQDTYLNVRGEESLLEHIRKCWASLFTDRAIAYRGKNRFDHRKVLLSVVVQQMVLPDISGILFTADPITGNRTITSIDASYGLGEALVSGLVTPDLYQVRHQKIVKKQVAAKKIAIRSLPEGGTKTVDVPQAEQSLQALTDEQILQLAAIGQQIERHYGKPQDVEWCLQGEQFYIVQSRPITSLYPVPEFDDQRLHVLFSFGHQQNMVQAMRPMGISMIRTFAPMGKDGGRLTESKYVREAGSHIFFDLTKLFDHRLPRRVLPKLVRNIDELASSALQEVITREEFLQGAKGQPKGKWPVAFMRIMATNVVKNLWTRDPRPIVDKSNEIVRRLVDEFAVKLQAQQGAGKIRVIQEELPRLPMGVITGVMHHFLAAIVSFKLMERNVIRWLGEDVRGLVDDLKRFNKGNVVTQMGLELGDLADVVRQHPAVMAYLVRAQDESFFEKMSALPGGEEVAREYRRFLQAYGMRGSGEIDMTTPRWRENPTQLIGAILGHIRSVEPGGHRVHFEQGAVRAKQAEESLLERVQKLPGGKRKAKRLRRWLLVYRECGGLREHPKFMIIRTLWEAKQAILSEAQTLVQKRMLERPEDVFFLTLPELRAVLEGTFQGDVPAWITARKRDFEHHETLTPPRVMTSEGEVVTGTYHVSDAPEGALLGSPVSAGIVEGRARIVLRPEEAQLEKGEILVAPFTDPGWTPLFLSAKGLITEVGGLMTHGAVVAREYAIPAVVGIDNATTKIKNGQRIRVNGTSGYVELLDDM